jgi:hypothetical protein
MTLADIGAGDGLIAFRAIDRVGPSLRVLLTYISRPLLRHAEALATQREIRSQCSFQHCSAENLTSLGPAWNYVDNFELRGSAYALDNLNRGVSLSRSSDDKEGIKVEDRYTLAGDDPYDLGRLGFVSLGYVPAGEATAVVVHPLLSRSRDRQSGMSTHFPAHFYRRFYPLLQVGL